MSQTQSTNSSPSHSNVAELNAKFLQMSAELYAGRDWHKLSSQECRIVATLEDAGYLHVNNPPNGFVGRLLKKH